MGACQLIFLKLAAEDTPKFFEFSTMSYPKFLECTNFRYIKIQAKTIDLSTRLWGINPTNSVVNPQSLVLRSIFWLN